MNPNRNPKYHYNGSAERHTYEKTAADMERDKLKQIEEAMDQRSVDIARTVANMFRFMSMSAAILPNMELDAGIMRLKVDDNGIFFEIIYPERHQHRMCSGCKHKFYDEDEEGLLYDGD